MTDAPLFHIRPATQSDAPALAQLTWPEGMDNIIDIEKVTVAVNADDEVVGLIRIEDAGGCAYVNPIVTYPSWRGHGVGEALMTLAIERFGEVRLVARGSSVGFYEKLGFENIPWEMVDTLISSDCEGCEMYEDCHPQPMRYIPED